MVDVDELAVTHQLAAFFLAQGHQVFGLDRHAADRPQVLIALLQRSHQVAVGQHIEVGAFLVCQRSVRQQCCHAQRGVAGQHTQHGI